MSMTYYNPTMEYGNPGDWEAADKKNPADAWRRLPTTTLKMQFMPVALQQILDWRIMDVQTEAMFGELITTRVVEADSNILETLFKFEGGFHARAEGGPFQILQTNRTNRALQLSLLGAGVEFTWERIKQNTPDLLYIAEVLLTRMKEANMLAALTAIVRSELTRMMNLNGKQRAALLMYAYRGMGLNRQQPALRDRFITEATTFLRGGMKVAYTPPGTENIFGTMNGPTVMPMRLGVNSMMVSSMEDQMSVSEYMRFVNLYDRRDASSASDRDIVIYDHAHQSRARLSFAQMAAQAIENSTSMKDTTWAGVDHYKNRPETQALYGRSKLMAAGLPLESADFETLVQVALDGTAGAYWNYATVTAIDAGDMQVGEETKRSIRQGKMIWESMIAAFKQQNTTNELLKTKTAEQIFNTMLTNAQAKAWSLLSAAVYIGSSDSLDSIGLGNLANAGVNLPIDLIVVRRNVRANFGNMVVSNGQPCINVYYSKPLAGANSDSTNMKHYASVSFGNAASATDDAQTCMMVVRGAVYRGHVENGGIGSSLVPVAIPPGYELDDVLPLTKDMSARLGRANNTDKFLPQSLVDASAYVDDDDELQKMLVECAVRSAYAYQARDGREVVVCNPNAPAHLTSPLRDSC